MPDATQTKQAVAGFIDVGAVNDFPVGKLYSVADIVGKDTWVLRTPGNKFRAIRNSCPHRGAPICLGDVSGTFLPSNPREYEFGLPYQVIRCPHHGWEFDLESGLPVFTGGPGRLVRYDVLVVNERVLVSAKGK